MENGLDFFDRRFIFENNFRSRAIVSSRCSSTKTKDSDPCVKEIIVFSTDDSTLFNYDISNEPYYIKTFNLGQYVWEKYKKWPDSVHDLPPVHNIWGPGWKEKVEFDDGSWLHPISWPAPDRCGYYRKPGTPTVDTNVKCIWSQPAKVFTDVLFRHVFYLPQGSIIERPVIYISLDDDAINPIDIKEPWEYAKWVGYFFINGDPISIFDADRRERDEPRGFENSLKVEIDPKYFHAGANNLLAFEIYDSKGDFQSLLYDMRIKVNICDVIAERCEEFPVSCISKGNFSLPESPIIVPPAYSNNRVWPAITIEHYGSVNSEWNNINNKPLDIESVTNERSQTSLELCAHERKISSGRENRLDQIQSLIYPLQVMAPVIYSPLRYGLFIEHAIEIIQPDSFTNTQVGYFASQILLVPKDTARSLSPSQVEVAPFQRIVKRSIWNIQGYNSVPDPSYMEIIINQLYRVCLYSSIRLHMDELGIYHSMEVVGTAYVFSGKGKQLYYDMRLPYIINHPPAEVVIITSRIGCINKYGKVDYGEISVNYTPY